MAMLEEEVIFNAARQIQSAEARQSYIEEACGGNIELRSRILALLRFSFERPSFLQPPNGHRTAADMSFGPGPGAVIGPYKLIEQIGEGGMGTVFLAEQSAPIQRQVALKIIKPGMDSRHVLARFEAERQALALMDHPNIARVIDAGQTEQGRPYFVMELVRGVSITKYCDEHQLTPRQRLELFIPVCQAVQHAHQKGIIHRDLKPSNVLVALYDDRPVPKIIDFGVAKATGRQLTDRTLDTAVGLIVGTLQYMSPEQASTNQQDIDTRSDIYSLGVILYELLTGTTPFTPKRLRDAAWDEVVRIIKEEEPQKPSTRISTADELPSIAANRGLEPRKLSGLVRGDLDWIVMRSLEKERDRRYATANGLARDIERFLHDEPVEAGPPSAAYKLRKFLRRNRGPVVAATLVFIALVGGIVGTSIGLFHAKQQRKLAEDATVAERLAKNSAQKRLEQIEKGNEVLGSIFDDLSPQQERAEGKTLRVLLSERLETAAKQLQGDAIGDPIAVARIQRILGRSLLHLGNTDKGIEILTEARAGMTIHLGAEHIETLGVVNNLAMAYQTAGRFNLALPLFEDTLKIAKTRFEPDSIETMTWMHNLASAYRRARKLDLAIPLFEETLRLRKAKLGLTDFSTLATMNNLGVAYGAAGKHDLALPILDETLKLRKQVLGLENSETLSSINNLAAAYRNLGQLDKAIPLFEQALQLYTATLGPDHPSTILAVNNLAATYDSAGKLDQAFPLYLQAALAVEKRKFQHETSRTIVNNLSETYEQRKEFEPAEAWRRKWLAVLKERGEADSVDYAGDLAALATNLVQQKRWAEAELMYRDCLAIREKKEPDSWRTFSYRSLLGEALLGQKRFSEAEPLLMHGYDGMKQREATLPAAGKRHLTKTRALLIQLYDEWGKPAEAEKWRKELPPAKP